MTSATTSEVGTGPRSLWAVPEMCVAFLSFVLHFV